MAWPSGEAPRSASLLGRRLAPEATALCVRVLPL